MMAFELQSAPMRLATRSPAEEVLRIAVVGYGYWGPNLVRNVIERPEMCLQVLCDADAERLDAARARHPGLCGRQDLETVLDDPEVEAIVVATPPRTHFAIAHAALSAGKHVLVEKPLATTAADARALAALAAERGLVVMPGHTFVYSPAVNLVGDLIHDGAIGDIHVATSSRLNLGKYQGDGVIWDLAPHDLSILLHWLRAPIEQVTAIGCSLFRSDVPETAFLTLRFAGGTTANLQLSWLAPRKVRQMVVVGSQRMVQYDDTASDEPVRIYDRGMDVVPPESFGEYQLTYRSGEVVIPRVEATEPLGLELADFVHAVRTGARPQSDVGLGVQIVEALEAAQESLLLGGAPVSLPVGGKLAA